MMMLVTLVDGQAINVIIAGDGSWEITLPQGQRLKFKRRPGDEQLRSIAEQAQQQISAMPRRMPDRWVAAAGGGA